MYPNSCGSETSTGPQRRGGRGLTAGPGRRQPNARVPGAEELSAGRGGGRDAGSQTPRGIFAAEVSTEGPRDRWSISLPELLDF